MAVMMLGDIAHDHCSITHVSVVSQVLIKDGELNKLSRKEMQPRMFFLVCHSFYFRC